MCEKLYTMCSLTAGDHLLIGIAQNENDYVDYLHITHDVGSRLYRLQWSAYAHYEAEIILA